MTPDQLSAIRARLDAVSDKEWFYDCVEEDQKYIVLASREDEELAYDAEGREGTRRVYGAVLIADCSTDPQISVAERTHNAALIANAPTDLRALLDEVERLTEALDEKEGDMHLRIRRGYDKTVADAWKAWAAKIEKERDEAKDEVKRLTTERDRAVDDCEILVREVHALGAGAVMKSLFNDRQPVAPAGSTPSPAPISDYRKSYALLFRRAEREKLEALARAERLTAERDAAFRRGAEAMRTALVQRVDWHSYMADIIRAEPVPEDR